jgi:hypothetical protein
MNTENHVSTGKLLVPKKIIFRQICFIGAVQDAFFPFLPGNGWLDLSHFLCQTGSCGNNQKTEVILFDVVNKIFKYYLTEDPKTNQDKPNCSLSLLAFLQCPFPPHVHVKHCVPVYIASSFTFQPCEDHPYQRR